MKVTFLGTGTSMGVPVAGGFKREDLAHDPRNERMRCSVWVQTNQSSLVIDAGPEFRIQSIRADIKHIDYVLITHEHMDHIGGLDDLRMYNYVLKKDIPVYTTDSAVKSIEKRFEYMFGENKYPGSTSLDLNIINSPINLNDLKITPLPVYHGDLKIFGFRVNDFSYLTDVKTIPESTKELIRGSKVVVLSALRWSPDHPTHLTIPESVEIINELEIPSAYLIHMNSYVDHQESNEKLPPHIRLAYDMQTIEID